MVSPILSVVPSLFFLFSSIPPVFDYREAAIVLQQVGGPRHPWVVVDVDFWLKMPCFRHRSWYFRDLFALCIYSCEIYWESISHILQTCPRIVPVTSQIHRRHIPEWSCVSYIIHGHLTPLNHMYKIVVNVLTVSQMCPRHIPDNLAFITTCSRCVNSDWNKSWIHQDCPLPDADMSQTCPWNVPTPARLPNLHIFWAFPPTTLSAYKKLWCPRCPSYVLGKSRGYGTQTLT